MSDPQNKTTPSPWGSESRPEAQDTPVYRPLSESTPSDTQDALPEPSAPPPLRPASPSLGDRPTRLGDQPPPLGAPTPPTGRPSAPLPSSPPPPPIRPVRSRGGCLLYGVLGLLACGIISAVAAIGGAIMGVQRFETGLVLPIDGGVREVQTAQFEVGTTPRLEVRNENGRTEIRVGDVRAVQVEATKRATGPNAQQRLNDIQLEMLRVGETTVRLSYRNLRPFNLFNPGGTAVDFVVTVPAGTAVDVNGDNGEVVIDGVRAEVKVEADNGHVTVRNVEAPVNVQTDNGRITLTRVRGRVTVQTDNGAIELQEVQADSLRVQSDNGRVNVDGTLGEGAHEIRTSNGGVTVRLLSDQRLRLDVQTDNGAINNRLQLTDVQTGRSRLSGVLNGGVSTLSIRTNNGGVTLEPR